MTPEEIKSIVDRAEKYLNSLDYEEEMCAIGVSIIEYEFCYAIDWCEKKELHLDPSKRRLYVGAGGVLVSKISDHVECEGSNPSVNWVYNFELKIQGLEEYWCLEILYQKNKISALKALLKCNTPELLKKVNSDSLILIEDYHYELERLKAFLDQAEVTNKLELRRRKINPNS